MRKLYCLRQYFFQALLLEKQVLYACMLAVFCQIHFFMKEISISHTPRAPEPPEDVFSISLFSFLPLLFLSFPFLSSFQNPIHFPKCRPFSFLLTFTVSPASCFVKQWNGNRFDSNGYPSDVTSDSSKQHASYSTFHWKLHTLEPCRNSANELPDFIYDLLS